MSPFIQSLIQLVISVLLGGKSWTDAVAEWLKGLLATGMTEEMVISNLTAMSNGVGCDCDDCITNVGASEDVGKFGDGSILKFLKTIDWAKFASFIMTIIAVIPKSDTSPGPVAD